ncbi:type I restriction enzyme S subunit [Roseospira visakhapatnamensis]|uniref:Type I restriction enzyme S subunit n=1 Tax=Roseospira visakhapatnamensis TaxID=390880 RepID=A0A7W6RGN8_9PROT|nr:type I restriction enzyme S subunit [Roseospira visakhapatnamensis]
MSANVANRLIDEGLVFIEPVLAEKFKRSIAVRGDLVFTCWGTTNQVGYVDKRALYDRYIVSNKQMKLTPNTKLIDALFLYYYFSSECGQKQIADQAIGSSVPGFNLGGLKQIKVPVPPRGVQDKVAFLLGALDDKIELNRRMNETLEAMARALFKDWFVDFGPTRAKMDGREPTLAPDLWDLFPDRFDAEGKPEGWDLSEIGREVEVVGGATPSTKDPAYWNGGVHHWVTPKDLSKLDIPVLLDTERKITDAGVGKISSGLLPPGTVLLSSRAPIGYLAIAEIPTAVNQGFIAMICKKRLPNVFVLFWCYENLDYIKGISGGSTFAEISKKAFRPIPVVVPSNKAMAAFEGIARPLYDRIVANTRESRTLAQTRDLLLPKLMSGEIRLRDAEKQVEAVA